jgi:hypothetical protein
MLKHAEIRPGDYVELLPVSWRAVNASGIKRNHAGRHKVTSCKLIIPASPGLARDGRIELTGLRQGWELLRRVPGRPAWRSS